MSTNKPMTLMAACRDYFGTKINPVTGKEQTALEFGAEYKHLTSEDKAEIKAGLENAGYIIMSAPGVK